MIDNNEKKEFLRINQAVNIFDIISCKEEHASALIAWLLNPREAHGLEDKFFAAFLGAFSTNGGYVQGYKYEQNRQVKSVRVSADKMKKAYQNVVVQTEYDIGSAGRVDILLCLEDVKCLFVIENKYGCHENDEQTKKYFKHFSQAKYKDYTIFYVYMDIMDYYATSEEKLTDSEHWHLINYDWVIDCLKDYLKKNKSSNNPVSKILQDIYIEFSGNYEDEDYFKPYFDNKKELAKKYHECEASNRYDILKKDKDVDAFNYRVFYNVLNDISFWEKYISLNENYIYTVDDNEYQCEVKSKVMSLLPMKINKKYEDFIRDKEDASKIYWPILCRLKHEDNKVKLSLYISKKRLEDFVDGDNLYNKLKKKNIADKECNLEKLPQELDKFLKKCSKAFDLVAEAQYKK